MSQVIKEIPKNNSEVIRVERTEFRGHDLVGIRVYVRGEGEEFDRPTKKGVTFRLSLLPEILSALQEIPAGAAPSSTGSEVFQESKYVAPQGPEPKRKVKAKKTVPPPPPSAEDLEYEKLVQEQRKAGERIAHYDPKTGKIKRIQ